MKNILLLAKNTFKESIRDRILYGILGFAIFLMIFIFFLSAASLGEDERVMRSIGLGGMYLFGMIITIFLGASLLAKEIDKKTLYFVLSRPISREGVILGKFLGLLGSIFLSTLILALAYLGTVYWGNHLFDSAALLAIFFQLLESMLFIAITLFFSTFLRPIIAIMAALVFLFFGHSFTLLEHSVAKSGVVLQKFVTVLSYIFPNLEKFNIRNDILYNFALSPMEITTTILYGIFASGLFLVFAALIFKKSEL